MTEAVGAQFEDETDERDFQSAMQQLLHPPRVQQKTRFLLVTLGIFVLFSVLRGNTSMVDLAILVGVLVVHELGHAIGMMVCGYRDVRVFFIPLFGAATAGRKLGVARWKQAFVLLLGPLPGIIAGFLIAAMTRDPMLHTAALMLLVVNALNLLPLEPLDGGQLFQVLLFSRNRHVEIVFRALTACVLVVGSIVLGMWIVALIGVFVLFSIPARMRVLAAAEQLRPLDLPTDPATLDDDQRRRLYRAAMGTIPIKLHPQWRGKSQPKAHLMEGILDSATTKPPSIGATVGLLGIWGAGVVLSVFGLVLAVAPDWQVYEHRTGFAIELPSPPTEAAPPKAMLSTRYAGGEFGVVWVPLGDDHGAWLETTRAALIKDGKLVRDRAAAVGERWFEVEVGGALRATRLVAGERWGYGVFAAPGDTELAERVLRSFRLTH